MSVKLPPREQILSRIAALQAGILLSLGEIDKLLDLPANKARSHIGTDHHFFPCAHRGARGKKNYSIDTLRRYVILLVLTNGINGSSFRFPDAKDKISSLDLNGLWSAYSVGELDLLSFCTSAGPRNVGSGPRSSNDDNSAVVNLNRSIKR